MLRPYMWPDKQDAMHMIWHHYELIDNHLWKVCWNRLPATFCNLSECGEVYFLINDAAK